jgi:hypothetical protein
VPKIPAPAQRFERLKVRVYSERQVTSCDDMVGNVSTSEIQYTSPCMHVVCDVGFTSHNEARTQCQHERVLDMHDEIAPRPGTAS